jgi:ComF family protein
LISKNHSDILPKTVIRTISAMPEQLAHILKAAIFPYKCLSCEAFFHAPSNESRMIPNPVSRTFGQVMSPFLCPECRNDFSPSTSVSSIRVGIVRAACVYRADALRKLIHAFKYGGKTSLARPLGMLLFSTFVRHWNPDEVDLILPVPLHIARLRERGFNQAHLMLKDWKTMSESAKIRFMRIEPELLLKIRHTKPQVELKREERKANIEGAFEVRDSSMVRGKKILLIDDVHTTGATVAECAKVLLIAGAARTDVLTLARTGKGRIG